MTIIFMMLMISPPTDSELHASDFLAPASDAAPSVASDTGGASRLGRPGSASRSSFSSPGAKLLFPDEGDDGTLLGARPGATDTLVGRLLQPLLVPRSGSGDATAMAITPMTPATPACTPGGDEDPPAPGEPSQPVPTIARMPTVTYAHRKSVDAVALPQEDDPIRQLLQRKTQPEPPNVTQPSGPVVPATVLHGGSKRDAASSGNVGFSWTAPAHGGAPPYDDDVDGAYGHDEDEDIPEAETLMAHLPMEPERFTGRGAEVSRLVQLISNHRYAPPFLGSFYLSCVCMFTLHLLLRLECISFFLCLFCTAF